MPVRSGKEYAEKWSRRLKGAIADITAGVEALDKNPAEEAIKAKEKMKAKLLEAIDSGRWEGGLKKVTLEEWKRKMLNKGIPNISRGVDEAIPDMEEFGNWLLPKVTDIAERVKREIPGVTLEDSIRRMEQFVREMAKHHYK